MNVHIVLLKFDITFNDADEGHSNAGEGQRIIKCFSDKDKAEEFIATFQPIVKLANGEHTVVPKQLNNRKLKNILGWDLHDFDQCEENHRFELQTVAVE